MDRSRSFLLNHVKPPFFNTFTCVVVLGGVIVAFLFAYAAFGENSESTSLKHACIIFRHGDKTPTSSYPNDPYKDATFWSEGWGALTIKGKKQMFQLGQFLHSRYSKFLDKYSLQTVRVDSSDHDRCHQSAGALLAALFPPQGDQVWNSQLLWQPIPIHATPLDSDKLIVMKAPCPLYVEEKRKSDAELAAKYDKQNEELYRYLSKHSGLNVSSLLDVESLFNILEIEKMGNKALPNWTVSVYPEKMKDIAALVLASFTYTPLMKRLKGGPLVGEITKNFNSFANSKSPRKMSMYAAHDVTIVNVRRALGFDDVTFKPDLGAAIVVELHVVGNEPQVELLYIKNYADTAPERWDVPGCPAPCSLSAFTDLMTSVIPSDWDAECQLTHQG